MSLEIIDCEQGTEEWLNARLGIVTASEFSTVMAKGRGNSPSKTRLTYMRKLVGERITGELSEGFSNRHTDRGHELEPEAVALYSFLTGNETELIGFMRDVDAGCSPDRLVGNDGLVEVKTKIPHIQIAVLEANEVPPEHLPQLYGQLWISQREWVDFISYWPKMPPFIKRVYRDEGKISEISKAVEIFVNEMHELEERIRRI